MARRKCTRSSWERRGGATNRMPKSYKTLLRKITYSLAHPELNRILLDATKRGRDAREAQLATLVDPKGFTQSIKNLKTDAISKLDHLVQEFKLNCERNGSTVVLARDGREAIDYIATLAQRHGLKVIKKSKSLTTEEIELNPRLEERGLEVIETDLGERIIQLAGEKPYHIVFPAVHKSQTEVAKLFSDALHVEVKDDLQAIMDAQRHALRPIFLGPGMGVTGANVAVAETGSIIVETNEGNARLITSIPDVHVVVVGMEKIVEKWEDALRLMIAHPMSATGTRLTNYVSMMSQRLPLAGHPRRELHVVILDNGRSRMREDPSFKEALNCIRCGACMNICPTYGVTGGHIFGYIYPGPIGIPWTEEVHGLDHAAEFAHLCIACGLCREICPADIDIPMMIAKVKEKDVKQDGQPIANRVLIRYEELAKFASATAPVSNWLVQNRFSRLLMHRFLGIEKRRKLPVFVRNTFEKRFLEITREIPNPRGRVVYFPDLTVNFTDPSIGVRAVNLLQESGIEVILPRGLKSSGYPYFSYGELEKATKIARHNVETLKDYVNRGFEVLATEPTATYAMKKVYPTLLGHTAASELVASHTFEFFEYAYEHASGAIQAAVIGERDRQRIGFHVPCHQRALSSGRHTIALLERAGYSVKVIETGTCCGMAGTFGLKKGPLGYELSMAVGRQLFDMFKLEGTELLIATESSVCTWQLTEGTGYRVVHPLELLVPGTPA